MHHDELRAKLTREAETTLPPSLAILLECAYEAENNPNAAQFLLGAVEKFRECAEKGLPLRAENGEVYVRELTGDNILVGIISAETLERELVLNSDSVPPSHEFDALVAETLLLDDVAAMCPMVVGVGVADTQEDAMALARDALFRSADTASDDAELALAEKRILARLNAAGPGAGGFGGRRTALSVAIEKGGAGYVAISAGDYFTSWAKGKLS